MTRVAIQGRLNAAQWVTKFKLAYGYDGVFFKDYKEDGDTAKVKDTTLKPEMRLHYAKKNSTYTLLAETITK